MYIMVYHLFEIFPIVGNKVSIYILTYCEMKKTVLQKQPLSKVFLARIGLFSSGVIFVGKIVILLEHHNKVHS